MAKAYINKVEQLSLVEKNGAIEQLTTKVTVTGLTDTNESILTAALAVSGVPQPGDNITGFDTFLIVSDRSAKVSENDNSVVEIIVTYENASRGNQFLKAKTDATMPAVLAKSSSNIQQIETNKDENGDLIVLEYTYPSTDPEYGGQTISQTGTITVFEAQSNVVLEGYYTGFTSADARNLKANIENKVNSNTWLGKAARTWLCTSVGYARLTTDRYYFVFEFQNNPSTWDPTAAFVDPTTGQIPPDVVVGTGLVTIDYLTEVNFDTILGVTVVGG